MLVGVELVGLDAEPHPVVVLEAPHVAQVLGLPDPAFRTAGARPAQGPAHRQVEEESKDRRRSVNSQITINCLLTCKLGVAGGRWKTYRGGTWLPLQPGGGGWEVLEH